jgi:hypothetical protein
VAIDATGFTVSHTRAAVSLATQGAAPQRWDRFTGGVSRETPFGREVVVVDPTKAEQLLVVDQHQGLRTWRWSLRTPQLVPSLRRDGRVDLLSGGKVSGLFIPAVALFDARGNDITPAGLRWSLVRSDSSWRLELRLDDSTLPLPYVIDPAIVFKASSTAGNMGMTASLAIPKPVGAVAGDFLLAQVTVRDNPTITAPAGWTFVRADMRSPGLKQAIYWRVAGAEPGPYTWTFSSTQFASGGIVAYAGVDPSNPIDDSSGNTGNSTTLTALAVTTSVSDAMVVGFFGIARSTTLTPGASSGMTFRYTVDSGGMGGATAHTMSMAADFTQATPGSTGNKTATAGQAADWVAQLVALRPAIRSTSTTLDCPATTPANTPATCTATVTDTASGTKSAPLGTVSFSVTSQPAGSTATVTPTCALAPASSSSSTCTAVFSADTLGNYTIEATYNPAPTSIHASSSGSDTINVTARSTSTTLDCPASTPANTPATCIVTVKDIDAPPKSPPLGDVDFSFTSQPAGSTPTITSDPCALTPDTTTTATDDSTCTIMFNSTKAGDYTIKGTYEPAPGSPHETSNDSDTIKVTPGPPAVVTVSPPTATNEVNSQHCVTATVTDAYGNPTPNITVVFSVTGVNHPPSATRTTDATGTTGQYCYVALLFGLDTIRAAVDSNNNGQPDATDQPFGEGTKVWTLPASTPLCSVDFPTYGGQITADNGDKANFGGNAHVSEAGDASGQEEYQDKGPADPMNVHSINVLAVVCTTVGTKEAQIYGEATIDGAGSHKFRIDVKDLAEPGVGKDTYRIILDTGYDSGENTLEGGNVQIH